MTGDVIQLDPEALREIVEKKATCPFIGTAVATARLPVRNEATNPVASIEDVRRLGNTGGGDLGDLLELFAAGNHAFMRGLTGQLNQNVPDGLFSLEFPGSQGSHPGHSGILEGDPTELDSGRLSLEDFGRLERRAINGLIRRSDVGKFIRTCAGIPNHGCSAHRSWGFWRMISGVLLQAWVLISWRDCVDPTMSLKGLTGSSRKNSRSSSAKTISSARAVSMG